jgi:drug/metabolite transporter (DMT)-like permease
MIFLGERPGPATLIGAAIVVGSGLYTFARERARNRRLSLETIAR